MIGSNHLYREPVPLIDGSSGASIGQRKCCCYHAVSTEWGHAIAVVVIAMNGVVGINLVKPVDYRGESSRAINWKRCGIIALHPAQRGELTKTVDVIRVKVG